MYNTEHLVMQSPNTGSTTALLKSTVTFNVAHVGKVASYDRATLKVPELFCKAILLPMFVYGDCMAVCLILYTSATGVAEMAESANLKACPHTFGHTVYLRMETPEIDPLIGILVKF